MKSVPSLAQAELKSAALLLALAPYEAHQNDAMRRVAAEPELKTSLAPYHGMLTRFLTPEICDWPLPENARILADPFIASDASWMQVLHDRVVEHNIRVVAKYYNRISISRLAEFVRLDNNSTEAHVSRMVTIRVPGIEPLAAKIDRPQGVIVFGKRKSADQTLSQLGTDISELLDLVETTVQLIHKENMMWAAAANERSAQ